MFLVTVLVVNTAEKRQKLDNNIFQVQGIAQKYNCSLKVLDYQQEQGLMSSIPLGLNQIEIHRALTTFCTIYHAGAFPDRRSSLLWSECFIK